MSAEESLLIGVGVNAGQVVEAATVVQSEALKPVAAAFAKNMTRVSHALSMPVATYKVAFVMAKLGFALLMAWQSEPVQQAYKKPTAAPEDDRSTPFDSFTQEVPYTQFLKALSDERFTVDRSAVDSAFDRMFAGLQEIEVVHEWIEGQLASATSAAWTAFECLATDM